MARRVKEPDLDAEQKENQITEALERKKRQLDQDVAEFKMEKEHEYRVFERKLRGRSKENVAQDAPQSQRKRGRSKQKGITAEVGTSQKEEAKDVQRELDNGKPGQEGPVPEVKDRFTMTRLKLSPGGSPGPPDRLTETLPERGKIYDRVCTPKYLPLVGGASANQGSRAMEVVQTLLFSSNDCSPVRHSSSAVFSSSAETVHPPMTSPPFLPARPLSSSVPPEKPRHHRSDSSRSDASIASLRSSLRDPKQPRSPKRVLFSIDDTLVSPSTSPIAQRSKSETPAKPADSTDSTSKFENYEVVRNQNGIGPATNRFESNGVNSSSSSASASGWTASLLTFGRAAELNLSKASPSVSGVEDFEHLESDDLFTFDEDMEGTGKNKSHKSDLEDEYDEDMEVDKKKNDDSLTASSPHAGSLPIEIKWPGKREGRG